MQTPTPHITKHGKTLSSRGATPIAISHVQFRARPATITIAAINMMPRQVIRCDIRSDIKGRQNGPGLAVSSVLSVIAIHLSLFGLINLGFEERNHLRRVPFGRPDKPSNLVSCRSD